MKKCCLRAREEGRLTEEISKEGEDADERESFPSMQFLAQGSGRLVSCLSVIRRLA